MNRRTLLRWLGLAPAVAVAGNSVLRTGSNFGAAPRASGLIWTQHGGYHCVVCNQPLYFEDLKYGEPVPPHVIGTCRQYSCPANGVRHKIKIDFLQTEIV